MYTILPFVFTQFYESAQNISGCYLSFWASALELKKPFTKGSGEVSKACKW